jgi:hypothetical protein
MVKGPAMTDKPSIPNLKREGLFMTLEDKARFENGKLQQFQFCPSYKTVSFSLKPTRLKNFKYFSF